MSQDSLRTDKREQVYQDIDAERIRQTEIHGDRTCDNMQDMRDFFIVLSEEVGEVARGIWENETQEEINEEVVQIAAVCVAFLERFKDDDDE